MAQLQSIVIDDTGYLDLPAGTTANRPVNTTTVVSFTSVGTTSWTAPVGVNSVEVLVVAGGGSGGRPYGGGGGAGGLIYNSNYPVVPGTSYTVTVGDGGTGLAAALGTCVRGNNGGNSAFGPLVAIGGGGGGCWGIEGTTGGDDPTAGKDGGSGGGGGSRNSAVEFIKSGQNPGNPTRGQGHQGGFGRQYTTGGSGGGGGAGQAGQTSDVSDIGGYGGDGLLLAISGTPTYYAGGGGGGIGAGSGTYRPAVGGRGGGGDGGYAVSGSVAGNGLNGTANTGGGGGGASGTGNGSTANTAGTSGAGGSGIVIIRYSLSATSTAATAQTRFNTDIKSIESFNRNSFEADINKNDTVKNGLVLHIDGATYTSGSTVRDISPSGLTGTLSNGTSHDPSDGGGSFVFDGVDDSIVISNNLLSSPYVGNGDVPFTLEAWFKVDPTISLNTLGSSVQYGASIIGHQTSAGAGFGFQVARESTLGITVNFMARNTSNYSHFGRYIIPDRWHHVVCSRPRGNGTNAYIYVDGVAFRSNTGDLSIINTADNLGIGYGGTRITEYFKGKIAIAKVYNRALTVDEVLQNYHADRARFDSYNYGVIAADPGNGGGFTLEQGADGMYKIGHTENWMLQYKINVDNQGASNSSTALSYSSGCPGGGNFSYHTGHQASWWPTIHAIRVSTHPYGKILNQIDWQTHGNAIGNVDIFGSNNDITQGNFMDESLYTHLGRMHFGGFGGGSSDCTVYTRSFNPRSFGYRWYMIKGVDNGGSLSYPSIGNNGGWAMYRLRLNKV